MSASSAAGQSPELRPADPKIEHALARIENLSQLELDWDSYGGLPSTPVARAAAIEWVEIAADLFGQRAAAAAVPYSVAPLAHGGVQLEWRGAQGIVELEVGPNGELGYLVTTERKGEASIADSDDVSWADVLRALIRVLAA